MTKKLTGEDVAVGFTAGVIAAAGLAAVLVMIVLVDAFVFQHLWNWYVPHAVNLPRLGTVDAIGISTLVGFATSPYAAKKDEPKVVLKNWMILLATALAMGWIALQFR